MKLIRNFRVKIRPESPNNLCRRVMEFDDQLIQRQEAAQTAHIVRQIPQVQRRLVHAVPILFYACRKQIVLQVNKPSAAPFITTYIVK